MVIGPFGLHASSQIVSATRTPATTNKRTVDGRRREVALLVEHRVVGQQVLAVHAQHASVRAQRRRVREVALRLGESDDGGETTGAGRELLERLAAPGDERRAQQQVFGRVAGERQLGEGDEVAAGGVGPLVGVEHAVDVAVEIADDEVELRGGESEAGHRLRIRDTACMTGGTMVLETADVATAIERSADARTARTLLLRAVEAHPELADELVEQPLLRDGLVALACASRSLASAVIADASLLDPLRDADDFARERTRRDVPRRMVRDGEPDDRGLRRWKRRELLRIAVRDLLGVADMPAVGRELAALAQVCLEGALAIVEPDVTLRRHRAWASSVVAS